jgi:hypothetical protein
MERDWYDQEEFGGAHEAHNPFADEDAAYARRAAEMTQRLKRRDGSTMSLAQSKRASELEKSLNAWEENRLLTSGVVRLKQVRAAAGGTTGAAGGPAGCLAARPGTQLRTPPNVSATTPGLTCPPPPLPASTTPHPTPNLTPRWTWTLRTTTTRACCCWCTTPSRPSSRAAPC